MGDTQGVIHPSVTQSVSDVIGKIQGIMAKDGHMKEGGNYKYLSIEKVIAELQAPMVNAGLVIFPTDMDIVQERIDTTRNGGTMHAVRVKVTYTVTGPAGDSITVRTIGEGRDSGDKAMNKAMSAAFKYALFELFFIAQADDPDHYPSEGTQSSRPATSLPPPPTPKALGDMLKAKFGSDKDKMQQFVAAVIGLTEWKDMSPDDRRRMGNLLNQDKTGDELLTRAREIQGADD